MGGLLIVEWLQLLLAATGMFASLWSTSRAAMDLHRERMAHHYNAVDELAGRVRRRRSVIRFVLHTIVFTSGVIVTDWRMSTHAVISAQPYYTRNLSFTAISIVMIIETLWEQYDRYVFGCLATDAEHEGHRRNRRTSDRA